MQKGGNMDDKFRDWIPEGEDTGAIGKDGFQDYVPAPEPKPQVIEEVKQPEPVVEPEPVIEPVVEPVIEQPQVEPVVEQPVEEPVVPSEPLVPPLEPQGGVQ